MEGDALLAANDIGSSVTNAMSDSNRRAIIFDPFPLLLEGVERVLGRVGVDVVGKATTPDHALAILSERRPDVLVAELGLRNGTMHGVDFVRGSASVTRREDRGLLGARRSALRVDGVRAWRRRVRGQDGSS